MDVRGWGVALLLSVALYESASAQTIFEAVRAGDAAAVRAFLEADPESARARDDREATPLHVAAAAGQVDIAMLLLASGSDVNAVTYQAEAPLHWAALRNRHDVAEALLSHGADVDPKESYGRTPLLLVARETGDVDMARRLVDAGADLEAQDRFGATSLGLSAWRGFADVVDLLLDHGAAIPSEPSAVQLMLGRATDRGLARLFRLVAERTTELDIPNSQGGTLLHSAAAGGSTEISEVLLDRGLDPDARDRYGRTPLHYAAENGRTEVVRLLLDRGAAPDARSVAGWSPLSAAEAFGRTEVEEILTARGAAPGDGGFAVLRGAYLGQPLPDREATPFAVDIVSTHTFQHGSITFSPDGTEAFWVSSYPEVEAGYTYGRILGSRLENGQWTQPERASFSQPRVGDDVPFFHPDGSKVYFLSSRGGDGERIWWSDRTPQGWSEPRRIEGGPNTMGVHWQFAVAADGSIYFSSGDPGGEGAGDLYVSRFVDGAYATPVNLRAPVNSEFGENAPFIAPDQSYLLFDRLRAPENVGSADIYVSFATSDGGWTRPRNLGPSVNVRSQQRCPSVSPDGRYLFFNSSRSGNADVYWMDASVIEEARQELLAPDLAMVARGEGWSLVNRGAETRTVADVEGVYLDARPGLGVAWLEGVSFTEGSLEVTLQGKNVPQASFLGLAFRGVDDETFEAVYFRPFNFQAGDSVARSHGVQYMAHPDHPWPKLRAESPGAYEAAVVPTPSPDALFNVRIDVTADRVRVFVNGAASPTLDVPALGERAGGRVGLWVGNNSDGFFANLRILSGAAPSGASSALDSDETIAEVRRVIESSITWALTKDKPLLDRVFSQDGDLFIYNPDRFEPDLGFTPLQRLWEEVWSRPEFKATGFDLRDLRIHLSRSGDVAWFSGVMDDIGEWDGQPGAWMNTRWTGVLERREGRWVMVQEHFSWVPTEESRG